MNIKDLPKQMGESIQESTLKSLNFRKNIFNNFISGMNELSTNDPVFEDLAVLLDLPDEQFEVLAPLVLEEINKSYSSPSEQILLAQLLTTKGIRAEDLVVEKNKLIDEIGTQLTGVISNVKISFLKSLIASMYNTIANVEGISKRTIQISIEYCHSEAKEPQYAHYTDSGMDVYAVEDIDLAPGETKLVPLGIKVAIPNGYELQVRPKSGRSLKSKLRIANTPGTIDAGYRDEIKVIAENTDQFIRNAKVRDDGSLYDIEFGSSIHIGKGEKFAQLVLAEVPKAAFYKVDNVSTVGEDRGGGFGSTGNR